MLRTNRPVLIGITGNIGSGKSTFSQLLRGEGYTVLDADDCAHRVLLSTEAKDILLKRWGTGIFRDGEIDRKALAIIVFSAKAELDFLNSIVHPRVLTEFDQAAKESNLSVLFFEIPLLFETNMESTLDFVILVTSSAENRIKRVMKRDSSDSKTTSSRIANQTDDAEKLKKADLVINNDGDLAKLKSNMQEFLSSVPKIIRRNVKPFI